MFTEKVEAEGVRVYLETHRVRVILLPCACDSPLPVLRCEIHTPLCGLCVLVWA